MSKRINDNNEVEKIIKSLIKEFIFWIGVIIAVGLISGFFIDSKWLIKSYNEAYLEFGNNDSDVGSLLLNLEIKFIELASWVKELSIGKKIVGICIGGFLCFMGADHDD